MGASMEIDIKKVPVIILCGGQGTRIREKTEELPKPMVRIGNRPILWHVMNTYSAAGVGKFLLALGYKGEKIREYFLNFRTLNADFTFVLGENETLRYHGLENISSWEITCADTGLSSMTGSRVSKLKKYIDHDLFMVTYGDGVADISITDVLKFHLSHKKIGTVTGVHSPSRFGKLDLDCLGNQVREFIEKPLQATQSDFINGGFFVFNKEFFNYLSDNEECVLERDPLERLAKDGELMAFKHDGFWRCMDTYRDWQILEDLWSTGNAPWATRS